MTEKKLIQKTRIKSDDGFVVAKMTYVANVENFAQLTKQLKQDGKTYPNGAYYMTSIIKSMYVKYLRSFCTDSFAVAVEDMYPTQDDDYLQKKRIFIAFRNEKELFKFIMKIGAKRTRWWRSSHVFTFVGRVDDLFEGQFAGQNWNYEDPQDMIL